MLKSQISAMTFSKVSSTKWKNRLGKGLTKKKMKRNPLRNTLYIQNML